MLKKINNKSKRDENVVESNAIKNLSWILVNFIRHDFCDVSSI